MSKVDENKRVKLTAMLDSALQLFTDQGISKTSISDIAKHSGVAKGTFYLYFKDKYDIRNKVVAYQSGRILHNAFDDALQQTFPTLEDAAEFIVNHVLDQLVLRPELVALISKHLSWAILKQEIAKPIIDDDFEPTEVFHKLTAEYGIPQKQSEIMLFLIVELLGSTCYSAILFREPCGVEELKPYLFATVRGIVGQFRPKDLPEAEA